MLDEHGTPMRHRRDRPHRRRDDPGGHRQPCRFRSAAAYASFAGTAPIAASSGDAIRHRVNRGGNRQLNEVLHAAEKTQIRHEDTRRPSYHAGVGGGQAKLNSQVEVTGNGFE